MHLTLCPHPSGDPPTPPPRPRPQDASGTPFVHLLAAAHPSLLERHLAALPDARAAAAVGNADALWRNNLLHVAAALPERERGVALPAVAGAAARLGLVEPFLAKNGKGQLPSAVSKNKVGAASWRVWWGACVALGG